MITWNISQLDRQISDGFVTQAHWQANASDEGYIASIIGVCAWSNASPTIPYAELTKDIVLGWIWKDGVDKAAVEASLTAQIDQQKAPKIAKGLPWN
jgi:hypothetical protein